MTDLAGPTGVRLPTVMRDLSVLEEAGSISTSKEGRIRTAPSYPRLWTQRGHGSMNSGPSGRLGSTGWTHL
ncbi:hypothetical protein MES5069_360099 [Mesorhizobium escarrei]|uniref:HTH iclR-type domain-containing protein n=1 Tax=Mesorhizobium escarrei TaxID=666018 RepID=A0ABM9E1M7_9HYPH|nr:hypothetical protein MES5069_360099 [Mesorhizobium escarrei]